MNEYDEICNSSLSLDEKKSQLESIKNKEIEEFKKLNDYYTKYAEIFNNNISAIDSAYSGLENGAYLDDMIETHANILRNFKSMLFASGTSIAVCIGSVYGYRATSSNDLILMSAICALSAVLTGACAIGCASEYSKYGKSIESYQKELKKN